VLKRISLLITAALLAAMMTVATAAPAFAATLPNKQEQTTKKTPNAVKGESGQTETAFRHGNDNTFTKNAGKSPPKSVTCTNREVKEGTCP
jgi:hypothetical protein